MRREVRGVRFGVRGSGFEVRGFSGKTRAGMTVNSNLNRGFN